MDCLRRLGGIEGGAGHSVNEQEGRWGCGFSKEKSTTQRGVIEAGRVGLVLKERLFVEVVSEIRKKPFYHKYIKQRQKC